MSNTASDGGSTSAPTSQPGNPAGGPLLTPAPSSAAQAAAALPGASTGSSAAQQPAAPPAPSPAAPAQNTKPPATQAEFEQALTTQRQHFEGVLEQLRNAIPGLVLEQVQRTAPQPQGQGTGGRGGASRTAAPAQPSTQQAPEMSAIRTELDAVKAQQVQTQKALEAEQQKVVAKEAEATRALMQQAIYGSLTSPEMRLPAEGASVATDFLMTKNMVVPGRDNPKAFFMNLDENGAPITLTLTDGLRRWLDSPQGMVFRPPVPAGSGGTGSQLYSAGASGQAPTLFNGPPSADKFSQAMRNDVNRRNGGGTPRLTH